MLLAKVEYLPKRLQAFRRYIEKYDCVTCGSPRDAEEQFTGLMFYHGDTARPYLVVLDCEKRAWPEIYVNNNMDNWEQQNIDFSKAICISNDMNAFLRAVHVCRESDGSRP